ncbi:MAG TPA: S8 family peptidase [Chloroflexaceae bacterium]|nr:S8 family peptidase [Chloroflexaceae bacterium]
MLHRLLLLLLALGLGLAALSAAAPAAASPDADLVSGEVLVRLRPGLALSPEGRSGHATLDARLAALGVRAARPILAGAPLYRLRIAPGLDPTAAAARLAGDPAVAYAEPNAVQRLARTPNDEIYAQQWALAAIGAPDAWEITTGGPVVVAVIDTGVDAGHPDLGGKVLPGFNVFTGGADAGDDNGHGTAVAGLIAANSDNGAGVAGLCWGCQILPVKALTGRGVGDDAGVAAAIGWAADQGARVINLSLGGSDQSQTLRDAVQYALDRGVVIVAASGNERDRGNAVSYPAAYPEVIAVGATAPGDALTGFSNTGDHLDLVAPGVGLWTTLPGGGYGPPNGTSFASPYVAATAALVLSLRADLGWYDVGCILQATADDRGAPGKDPEYGYGRLNVRGAVELAAAYPGCPLAAPAPQPAPEPAPQPAPGAEPQPAPGAEPPAFAPVPPPAPSADVSYFPETGHTLRGAFRDHWRAHGGLAIFGYPTSEELVEAGPDGRPYTVQYFERHRLELHPENGPPYNVLLSRIGDDVLRAAGRDWFAFPKTGDQPGCVSFEATGQSLCEPFLSYWRSSGLEFDGAPGKSYAESLALFGQPLSPPQLEEVAPGVFLSVQWFERARFEDHGAGRVLLGLLGNEVTRLRGWR